MFRIRNLIDTAARYLSQAHQALEVHAFFETNCIKFLCDFLYHHPVYQKDEAGRKLSSSLHDTYKSSFSLSNQDGTSSVDIISVIFLINDGYRTEED